METAFNTVVILSIIGFLIFLLVVGVTIAVTGKTPWQLSAPSRQKSARAAKSGNDGIFISYRRQDEPNFAGRLYDRLVANGLALSPSTRLLPAETSMAPKR